MNGLLVWLVIDLCSMWASNSAFNLNCHVSQQNLSCKIQNSAETSASNRFTTPEIPINIRQYQPLF